ncbi:MAG: Xaa-Pro peptidase family protein [bacterium]|nr:Xaa-Pro peptidase family protein [bacterium]
MIVKRIEKVLQELKNRGMEQMVVTDPFAIDYLIGKFISPGERFLALYITATGEHKLFVNRLFTVPEEFGMEKIWFTDTENPISMLAKFVMEDKPLGIDKNMLAKFLLPLMDEAKASAYVNASICVDNVRALKDEEEKECMREASRINDAAMAKFKDCIKEGMTEVELSSQFLDIYKSLGADGFSFPPLVGFGESAAIGHYEGGEARLKKGDCVLIDVGCIKNGYCSDMTRTFFVGEVSDKHREVYEIVRKAQAAALAMIKPGVKFSDIDKTARDIITEAGYGPNFTHRLGHFIGREVHEYGDVSSTNQNLVKEGMTFSIEPGIYIEGDIGIRIEDLVLVTKDGVEILNSFPKELTVV